MVENTVANIHKAFTGYQNRLSAWAYFEVNGISMISRLVQKNRLFSVPSLRPDCIRSGHY
ncbi:MAG: hypothetical protein R2861_05750 [Desulfobacterales bacterium]